MSIAVFLCRKFRGLGLVFTILFFAFALQAQERVIRLVDSQSKEPIAYANALLLKKNLGTASDLEGRLRIKNALDQDTLLVRYIGYDDLYVLLPLNSDTTVYLHPKSYALREVQILPGNDFLYELVQRVRKSRDYTKAEAKSYFHLESKLNGSIMEQLEMYYNTQVAGSELRQQQYKIGRLASNNNLDVLWISSESSQALLKHQVFEASPWFPLAPLQLSKRQLKNEFNLDLIGSEKQGNSTVWHLSFSPKEARGNHFSGEMWIDEKDERLLAVKYQISDAKRHPFVPLGKGSIERVDMEINKQFSAAGHPKQVDFDYTVSYRRDWLNLEVSTQAAQFFYDYQELFTLPIFDFRVDMHYDYRMIAATPYNERFWKDREEFMIYEAHSSEARFLNEKAEESVQLLFKDNSYDLGFESPYVFWREAPARVQYLYNRVVDGEPKPIVRYQGPEAGKKNEVKVQLFVDINRYGQERTMQSMAVLDPYQTQLISEDKVYNNLLVNLAFDEGEWARRELLKQISNIQDPSIIRQRVQGAQAALDLKISELLFACRKGLDSKALIDWNSSIKQRLGIDNMAVFVME